MKKIKDLYLKYIVETISGKIQMNNAIKESEICVRGR